MTEKGESRLNKDSKKEYEVDERIQYNDPISEMVKRAEKEGHFDRLPGKGKPLKLANNYFNPEEKQLYKTMKDNHVLPRWIELANEIDALKEEIAVLDGKQRKEKMKFTNKKIKQYNRLCPPSLQRNKIYD
ncbi:DUF1992 domain-containing protein [Roseburia sp. 1XD42-34]|nr:DUF1992 domain-containing protein [Roseburia sp. 1XD42-34]RKI77651.1 DUF1992 domain-containing protein [Clostridium sp. 1xD42-85]